jgi:hypothetical protein
LEGCVRFWISVVRRTPCGEKGTELTVEVSTGTSNRRHKGDRIRGTIITVKVVLTYFVSDSLI